MTTSRYTPVGIGPRRSKAKSFYLRSGSSVGIKGSGGVACPTNWHPWNDLTYCSASLSTPGHLTLALSLSFVATIPTCLSCAIASTCCLRLWGIIMRVPLKTTLLKTYNSWNIFNGFFVAPDAFTNVSPYVTQFSITAGMFLYYSCCNGFQLKWLSGL